ncbi:hypothetical protein GYA37_03685 [candidate division WWE3 bacterium]|uniref:DUF350 domain-containing protein n=1 Tax=candidate division WWE3 bacterium TaxID=2053526 RepID=A0A7X9E7G3_UNCKA|nr:hypothetical protein [candidate division WWE3 bacterium]
MEEISSSLLVLLASPLFRAVCLSVAFYVFFDLMVKTTPMEGKGFSPGGKEEALNSIFSLLMGVTGILFTVNLIFAIFFF